MALKKFRDIVRTVKMIDCDDWDDLVSSTYGRPYCFQQQDGCQSRGIVNLTIPDEDNVCIVWNDPVLDIDWGIWNPIVSEKDSKGILFKDFITTF